MSYYWFNREELLQKANNRYQNCGGKQKAAEYYLENEELLKGNARKIETIEKEVKREYGKNRYRNVKENKKTS